MILLFIWLLLILVKYTYVQEMDAILKPSIKNNDSITRK